MSTLAHRISTLMPARAVEHLRPRLNDYRVKRQLRNELGGSLRFDETLQCQVARRDVEGVTMELPVRSPRELARFVRFGDDPDDLVYRWLMMIDDCKTLYDVGSANGLEGFFAAAGTVAACVLLSHSRPVSMRY